MAQTANQDPASIMFNWALWMRPERRPKRKCVCWIAQFFNLQDSSTFFLLSKKRKGNTRRAFATWFANHAGRTEGLFGEGEGKEWGISLTNRNRNPSHVVVHCLHSLRLCSERAGLSLPGAFTGILKHLAVTSAPQRRVISPYFWRDYFELSHLLRL